MFRFSTYQKLKPVYDAYSKTKNKQSFRAAHEAELVVFEAAKSTLLAMQDGEKLPSMKSLQAEQQRLLEEQQRLYDERARLKKEAKVIDTKKPKSKPKFFFSEVSQCTLGLPMRDN